MDVLISSSLLAADCQLDPEFALKKLKAPAGWDIQPSLRLLLHFSYSFDTNLNEKVKQGTCLKSTRKLGGCKSTPKAWKSSPHDHLNKGRNGWSTKYSVLYNLNHYSIKLRMMSQAEIKSVLLTYLQGYAPVICLQINLSTFLVIRNIRRMQSLVYNWTVGLSTTARNTVALLCKSKTLTDWPTKVKWSIKHCKHC